MANLLGDRLILGAIQSLSSGMIDYLQDTNTYTKKDVEECTNIVYTFLGAAEFAMDKGEFLKTVEISVKKLNRLNEKCQYQLIETDQREEIAGIMIRAGFLKGFNGEDEDVTEEWREW